MKNSLLLFIFFSFYITRLNAQNLLVNPSAEIATPATNGWTVVSIAPNCYTSSGWRILGNQNGFPLAQNGSYFFYPGCTATVGTTYELYQDVNVSINGPWIDGGGDFFTMGGYMQSYTQTPPDQAEMIMEFRNSTNTTVLGTYNTGFTANQGSWVLSTISKAAPVGTRYVRVRLLSKSVNGTSVDGYFDNLSLFTSIALPVVFTSFNANAGNGTVKLSWATSSEFNNEYFIVQRSQNSNSWEDVEKINGSSNSNIAQSYSATDDKPFDGISFYRLKQIDMDGNARYSEVREVDIIQGFSDISVFPNPAQNAFTVKTEGIKNTQVSIYNSLGQLMIIPYTSGNSTITFNASALAKGIYFVRLNNGINTVVKKVSIN